MSQENPRRTLLHVLFIGRMSLWASWPLAFPLTVGAVLLLVTLFSDSSLEPLILTVWLVATAVATPIVARRKGRRTLLWVGMTAGLLFLARFPVGIILQPLTALLAVSLGGRPPEQVDYEAVEETEDPEALAELESIRANMAGLREEIAPLLENRDMAPVGDRLPEFVAAETAVNETAVQVSPRGHRARVHLTNGIRGLQTVASGAEGAATFLRDNHDLRTLIAKGETRGGGQGIKSLNKEFKRIDRVFEKASRQLLLSEIGLDAMGYGVRHDQPMPWLPPIAAPAPTAPAQAAPDTAAPDTEAPDAEATAADRESMPPDTRPRPVRGRRRQRF